MILITNNSKVSQLLNEYPEIVEFNCIDTLNILEVFKIVRNYIHSGHRLLSHPLSGSVKPGETPFKSVLISKEKFALDMQSLLIIEDAILMASNFIGDYNEYKWKSENILEDFSIIDYRLIESALESANQR